MKNDEHLYFILTFKKKKNDLKFSQFKNWGNCKKLF